MTKREVFDWQLDEVMKPQFMDKDGFRPGNKSITKSLFGVFGLSRFRSKDRIKKIVEPNGSPQNGKIHQNLKGRISMLFTEIYEVEERDKPKLLA